MERNIGKRRRLRNQRRRQKFETAVTFAVIAAFIIGLAWYGAVTAVTLNRKEKERDALNAMIREEKARNELLTEYNNTKDQSIYMEKAAVADYNYAYPNERRFFDTSRNGSLLPYGTAD